MMFKTLEEANEWRLEQEKKMQELNTAYEGLQNKLGEAEASLSEKQKEIDGLKIKNYEFLTQLTAQIATSTESQEEAQEAEVNFDDFLKNFQEE